MAIFRIRHRYTPLLPPSSPPQSATSLLHLQPLPVSSVPCLAEQIEKYSSLDSRGEGEGVGREQKRTERLGDDPKRLDF
ncbi:hypothetical protein OPV22_022684 [Ensete ventricosum]|uniref:Uncharacterized protein n=1 Tax=Ensete ventricosum TaxID=4639 RepID=A0AAV8QTF9_ENSVE|nr:hypothetical protein OPV22_022684 [Ensete ventricosum]